MSIISSHEATFPSIMAKYTDFSYDYFFDFFGKHEDNWLNYLLRTAIPSEYTFDGLKEVCLKDLSSKTLELVAVFWFLKNGKCINTAIQFSASIVLDTIEFEYSVLPESQFVSLDGQKADICMVLAQIDWPVFSKTRLYV